MFSISANILAVHWSECKLYIFSGRLSSNESSTFDAPAVIGKFQLDLDSVSVRQPRSEGN